MDYIISNGNLNHMDEMRIREGFPKQRLVVMAANVIERCRALPMASQIYVTDIGLYPSAPHHYVERKTGIPPVILIYCLQGKGFLCMGNKRHVIGQGHAVLIPGNTPHCYGSDDKDPWSVFWIHFDGMLKARVLESLGTTETHPTLYVPDAERMRRVFEEVFACLKYHFSDAGLLAMSSELLRLLSHLKLHQGHTMPQRQRVENRVMNTIAFMEKHVDLPLKLGDLATHSGQSIPYYSKLFKERTNQSPMNYFIQIKIRKACELLDHTDYTIRQISESLGYDDPYYFSRLFKKVQGMSPSNYRKR